MASLIVIALLDFLTINSMKKTDNFTVSSDIFTKGLTQISLLAVCDKTFQIYSKEPYNSQIIPVESLENISLEDAKEFDCRRIAKRHPRESKEMDYDLTDISNKLCSTEGCC